MIEELKKIREDLMYANDNNNTILIGFAINRLDSLIYKQSKVEKLPLASVIDLLVDFQHFLILDGYMEIEEDEVKRNAEIFSTNKLK